MDLDPAAVRSGVRLVSHDTIGSTNADAIQRARAGERGPLWVTAQRQTAGRGRRGRVWVSEPGNLYASLLLTDPSPTDRGPELSLLAALAVHDAVASATGAPGTRLTLKWPNDLLLDGAKLAGVLVEAETGSDGILAAVVGIGINCSFHPADTAYAATDLAAAGLPVKPHDLFRALSGAMPKRLAEWNRGQGFRASRAAWLARATWIGSLVRVSRGDRETHGRFETLDDTGRLVLRSTDGGVEHITSGELRILDAAAGAEARGQ